ncbi:MAG: ATP-binding protein [Bacteroidales bacterium]|nr:ATP-binding protein [Bacteroidales bacterium]
MEKCDKSCNFAAENVIYDMELLKRKIDTFLSNWKGDNDRKPLIVKGARQVGKTESIRFFAKNNYKNVIEINFVFQKQYKQIFSDGYDVESIIKNISLLNPSLSFPEGDTLFFFDELQECPDCATCLKSFMQDGRYDVICSGSLMGVYYKEIESNSVGYKEDYEMYSLDFEEFLWAKGYSSSMVDDVYAHLETLQPFSALEFDVLMNLFKDYMILGGMPEVVYNYVKNKNFSGSLNTQKQLRLDYEEDITKYAKEGLERTKILNIYRHIPVFLAKDNKKFQITKVAPRARNREYIGSIKWLENAGIINACYCMQNVELPLKGNYDSSQYKVYFNDTGMLIASLDEEAQDDLRINKNFATYKGAIYENIVAEMLVKQGYNLFYYKNEKSTVEMDFFIRNADSLIPVEVKANDNATASLNKLIESDKYPDIKFGIKLCNKNIGYNGKFYTLPYFLTFLLKRWLRVKVY